MGCGNSKQQEDEEAKRRERDEKAASYREEDDPDLICEGDGKLSRKESAAVNADEPGNFVSKMKQMYQVRKAKMNGANEDVEQYADEIRQSIPTLSKRDKNRIQEWINSVGDDNPGNVFEEIPEDGRLRRTGSTSDPLTAGGDGVTPAPLGDSLGGSAAPERSTSGLLSPNNFDRHSSALKSPNMSTTDAGFNASRTQLPNVPDEEDGTTATAKDADGVPLLQVTSTGSAHHAPAPPPPGHDNTPQPSAGMITPTSHALDASMTRDNDGSSVSEASAVAENPEFTM